MTGLGSVLRGAALAMSFAVMDGVVAGQFGAGGATVVTEQTHGDVSLKVGAVLEVRLEANHTTGYSWVFAPAVNPVLMRQGKTVYQEHVAEGTVGVGGVEVWRFKAMKAGKQGLQFEYRRPWEKGTPPAKVVTFAVIVE
ncbi:MAG TPA: protease inhibitor I42 family protein [Edaphobacter sp.]|jgi:inhibitor of cysteine peptidase|nr:protease inhibitor I42 family protein [Edaphobacter sp.]